MLGARCSHQSAMAAGFAGEIDPLQDIVDERAEAAGVDRRGVAVGRGSMLAARAAGRSERTSWPVSRENENCRRAVRSTAIGATSRGTMPPPVGGKLPCVFEHLEQVGPARFADEFVIGLSVLVRCGRAAVRNPVGNSAMNVAGLPDRIARRGASSNRFSVCRYASRLLERMR